MRTKGTQMFARNIYAYRVNTHGHSSHSFHPLFLFFALSATNVFNLYSKWITSLCIIFHLLLNTKKSKKQKLYVYTIRINLWNSYFVRSCICSDATFSYSSTIYILNTGKLECHANAYNNSKNMRSNNEDKFHYENSL